MKKKLKWVVNIATLCLCACLAAIGVYAAKNASITAGGTISFSATNIFAEVECEVLNAKTEVTFNKIKIDATKTDETFTDNTTWAKNLEFAEDGSDITMKFTITNLATDRPLYAKITNTTNATNLDVFFNNYAFTNWFKLTEQAEGSETNKRIIEIYMHVSDKDMAVDGTYGFNIELNAQGPAIPNMTDFPKLSFGPLGYQTMFVWAVNKGVDGAIEIPSQVMMGPQAYSVEQLGYFEKEGSNSNMGFSGTSITTIIIPETVKVIANSVFHDISTLTDVFFLGTREQWNAITIEDNNESLLNATITCIDD